MRSRFEDTKQTRARRSPMRALMACAAVGLCGCGPQHEGEDPGGDAGDSGGGAVGTAGGGSSSAGVCTTGGSGGSGGSGIAQPDGESGCQGPSWPDAGSYYEPARSEEFSTHEEILLSRVTACQLSGNGKVVVGVTSDPPRARDLAVAWSVTTGFAVLPVSPDGSGQTRAVLASCDGSVIIQQDVRFGGMYRTEAGESLLALGNGPPAQFLSMTPSGGLIVDGRGYQGEFATIPQLWERESGALLLPDLQNEIVYGIAPNSTMIAGNADELFQYEIGTGEKTPIGMAAVDFGSASPSIRVAASGEAWVQSADLNYDSFLVWRPPAEPISVTCPSTCYVVDVSGSARVALLDIPGSGGSIWSPFSGFVDLSTLVTQMGVDLGGRELSGVAISDDGRVVAGNSYDPVTSGGDRFFHLVLPSGIFQP